MTEDVMHDAMTVGKYSVVNPNEGYPLPDNYRITVRVTSPYGSNYHYMDHVDSGNFAFTASEGGDYMTCFWAVYHRPQLSLSIDFEWKSGVAAKGWSKIAKRGQIHVMEIELQKLFDIITSIHDDLFYLREREEEMQELNRATNSKMATFTALSLLICLSVAGLQIWHLKSFFEKKKLI
ncbi:hypothetical protein K7X08_023493 [Anisodus acutangulus]|uniref:GOLD domain-containing protein n=1 Tax=Anisodus acutangulus TaxID=402998 RepID=A0A9Q1L7B7_9SOLA|nr:hypothetical protein K7X08_023493 [Anisodus acutangulus]